MLLVFLGVSGVGKSTLMRSLREEGNKYFNLPIYTTRQVRPGETEKRNVSEAELISMRDRGTVGPINEVDGHLYAPDFSELEEQANPDRFSMLDWPYAELSNLLGNLSVQTRIYYLAPPTKSELEKRLIERDQSNARLLLSDQELKELPSIKNDPRIDRFWVSETGKIKDLVKKVQTDLASFRGDKK